MTPPWPTENITKASSWHRVICANLAHPQIKGDIYLQDLFDIRRPAAYFVEKQGAKLPRVCMLKFRPVEVVCLWAETRTFHSVPRISVSAPYGNECLQSLKIRGGYYHLAVIDATRSCRYNYLPG